jgi:3-oxoacyl-[acyl-carrier-protein] synthase II
MRRVVVTGIGLITPLGFGRADVWQSLLEGKSGVGPVTSFDTSEFPVHIGAEVKGFAAERYLRRQKPSSMGRASQMAVAAGYLALQDAGIQPGDCRPDRSGVSMGTTSGEAQFVEQYNDFRHNGGIASIPSELPAKYPCHVIPSHIAVEFGFRGPCLMIPAACAAGNYAIGYAFDLIRSGTADFMLAGGSDPFSRITYMGFARLGAIAPERCQPFDRNRKGMIPGEGAAVLVLEPLDAARARGATVYAEIMGYGLSCDAHHMTAGHPDGDGAARAMAGAIRESGIRESEVDYISAHGTGTPANDRVEALAIKAVFGKRAAKLPVSSIKSMLGHTMGAASAIEAAACALAIATGRVPPTINYEEPDPECELDCVPNQARTLHPRVVLNNAYAFGGNNASLCMARCDDGAGGAL